ncbi:serine hydrolase domain-containing protein [Thermodesulfobacteriota bacterium]
MHPSRKSRTPCGCVAVLVLALLFAGGCAGTPPKGALRFDPSLVQPAQTVLDAALIRYRLPGAVLGIRDPKGAIQFWTSGRADLEMGKAMDRDLYFRIGSVTKSYTATIILQLVDEGLVVLDTPIGHYLPDKVDQGERITVRNLLEMRSGLGNYSKNQAFFNSLERSPGRVWTPDELLNFSNTAKEKPGGTFDYNNANYIILGMLIEMVTKSPYRDQVKKRILKPLGMTKTFIPISNDMPTPFARGYLYEEGAVIDGTFSLDPSVVWSAGNIISTASDQLVWIKALEEGRLLSKETHKEQFAMKDIKSTPGRAYGLGVGRDKGAMGHGGNYNDAYTSCIYRYHGYDFVVLVNGQGKEAIPKEAKASNVFWRVIEDMGL